MATHSSVLAWRIPGTGEPGNGVLKPYTVRSSAGYWMVLLIPQATSAPGTKGFHNVVGRSKYLQPYSFFKIFFYL